MESRTEKYLEAALDGEAEAVADAPEGDRNNALFRAAASLGGLVDAGLDETAIHDRLADAAEANGLRKEGGLRGIHLTIRSGLKRGMRNPRDVPFDDSFRPAYSQRSPAASRAYPEIAEAVAASPAEMSIQKTYQAWRPEDGGEQPRAICGADDPPAYSDEIARFVYRRAGEPVRVKIKSKTKEGKRFTNWYKVQRSDGDFGWQAGKPEGFEDVPYVGRHLDPFGAEIASDWVWLPEGEKDVDSLSAIGLPSLTFGGASDLPGGWEKFVVGRDVIICPDNDDAGRKHSQRKAAQCFPVARSVKVLNFKDTTPGGDVTDWLCAGHTNEELRAMAEAAPIWKPSSISAISAIPASVEEAWEEPDWSILDGERGDLPSFPIHAFSPEWQDWLKRSAHGAGVEPDYVALPLLGVASSLIGTARRIAASRAWSQPCTLWIALVARSGAGKTPGLDTARRPLRYIDQQRRPEIAAMRRAHEATVEKARIAEAQWKAELKDALEQNTAPPDKPAEATPPLEFIEPRLFLSSVTIERVPPLLKGAPRGLLCIYDELSSFLNNMHRYSGGEDNSFWLETWNGEPYIVERQKGSCLVDHLLVGITGGIQPDILADAFDGDHDGMYARFCFGWPAEPAYQELTDEVAEIEPEIVNALNRIIKLPTGEGDEFVPGIVKLSPDARQRFEEFRRHIHQNKQWLDGRERDWANKGPAHVLRMSGTLAFLEWSMRGGAEPSEVEARHMESAILIWKEYFQPHSLAAMRRIGVSDNDSHTRRVLNWIMRHRKREVSVEDIRRHALCHKVKANETERFLDGLVEARFLRPLAAVGSGPGRPKRRWLVNPKLLARGGTEIAENAETREMKLAA